MKKEKRTKIDDNEMCVKGIDEVPMFSWNTKTKEFYVLGHKFDGINSIEATYRWLAYHSMLNGDRGDGILIGASKMTHLKQNMETIKAGPLPEDVVSAFEKAWMISKNDSPEYFALYKAIEK